MCNLSLHRCSNLHVFHVSVSGSCHLSLPIQSPLQPLCTHAPGQWAPKELPPGKQILVAHLLPRGHHSANCMAFPAAWPMICSSKARWTSGECNNETTMKLLATAQGCKEVNAAPYLISILKCHQNYSAKNSSGFNGVYQQSTEQDVGCGQSLW